MLIIDRLKDHYKQILQLKASTIRLTVRKKMLSFEIDTRPQKTITEHPYQVESRDMAVEYNFANFQSLVRLANRFKWKIMLSNDYWLRCSVESMVSSTYIKGKQLLV